jgi:serine/threonine-protein kinase
MGEVWRATDTKLGRGVAIKVLPEEFTRDAERLARFEREARVLASLDHSNIASIHGIEDVDGMKFLVMQLAEGQDLSDRLQIAAIPVDEALAIARQLCEGLDAAHEKGVIHRDLKPANIKLDADGNVRILDFGLAKAMDVEDGDSDITNSPTMVRAATHSGMILGTASYMSPEQARGKRVDKRADIWAFGVVLWEMLTGQRLFRGETVSDTLAAVLTRDVDLDALPDKTPRAVRTLLGRCLERNPKKRLRDIGEATLALERAMNGEAADEGPVHAGDSRFSRPAIAGWVIAALLLVAFALTQFLGSKATNTKPQRMQLEVKLSEQPMTSDLGASAVVSPDGGTIVFVVGERAGLPGSSLQAESRTRLHVRQLAEAASVPLAGTDDARTPFFSPDGEWVGFFSGGKLRKISVSGGAALALCDARDARGGTWGPDNIIVFSPDTEAGLMKVSADGGTPEPVTSLDSAARERSHRWPWFLPDGRAIVFMAQTRGDNYQEAALRIVLLDSGEVRDLSVKGTYPRVTPSGHLTWVRDGVLLAAPFDLGKLETAGPPRPVLENVMCLAGNEALDDGTAHYSFSSSGLLVYRVGVAASTDGRLAWLDRAGKEISRRGQNDFAVSPRISPDGRRVAMTIESSDGADIWIWDVDRDTMSRLTFDEGDDRLPVWSPDGSRIAYSWNGAGETGRIRVKASDGSGAEVTLAEGQQDAMQASSWSPDGTVLFGHHLSPENSWDVVMTQVDGPEAGVLKTIASSPATDVVPEVSPDGKWIAYMSDETGLMEIYIRAVPDTGGRWQVSMASGIFPRWTKGGREIVFQRGTSAFHAVSVDTSSGTPQLGRPEKLFEGDFVSRMPFPGYDVSADGERFLVLLAEEKNEIDASHAVLVTNWFDRLKEISPGR